MIKIRKIQVEPTSLYDITVPETSAFVANNIVVHNCAEITLPTEPVQSAEGGSKRVIVKVPKNKVAEYKEWRKQWKTMIPPQK